MFPVTAFCWGNFYSILAIKKSVHVLNKSAPAINKPDMKQVYPNISRSRLHKLLHILLVTLVFTLGCTIAVHAQIGFKGGVNLANFIGQDAANSEDVMGLNAGISLTLIQIGPLAITPEVYYAQKGARFSDQLRQIGETEPTPETGEELFDLEFRLDYIEVPILAKITLPIGSRDYFRPFILGGPIYAWRLDCQISLTSAEQQSIEECTDEQFTDVRTAFNNADRGFVVGTGIDLDIPYLGTITLDGRYVRGLSRLRDDGVNDDIHNRSFTLMLGYSFGLGARR